MNNIPEVTPLQFAPRSGIPITQDRILELSKQGIEGLEEALQILKSFLGNEPWLRSNPQEALKHILSELPNAVGAISSVGDLLKSALESRKQEINKAPAPYIYLDGAFRDWANGNIHFLSHTVQYGTGAFEGIRAYATKQGIGIFRLPEHLKRLQYSAKALGMDMPLSENEIQNIAIDLLNLNKLGEVYIRPTAMYDIKSGVSPKGARCFLGMACWPWGKYLQGTEVFVSDSAKHGGKLKVNGYYVELARAKLEIEGTQFCEVLLRDPNNREQVAEGGGENIFVVRKGVIYTPPKGVILEGITRETFMVLAKARGLEIREEQLLFKNIVEGDEIFLSGTAAELSPVTKVRWNDTDYTIGDGEIGEISALLMKDYDDVVHGRTHTDKGWITYIDDALLAKRSGVVAENRAQI